MMPKTRHRVPLLSTKNKYKQFQWAHGHQHWTTEEWKNIAWNNSELSLLEWPGQSPDLNPIERLWYVMEGDVRSMNAPPSNLQQLRDAIVSAWNVSDTL